MLLPRIHGEVGGSKLNVLGLKDVLWLLNMSRLVKHSFQSELTPAVSPSDPRIFRYIGGVASSEIDVIGNARIRERTAVAH